MPGVPMLDREMWIVPEGITSIHISRSPATDIRDALALARAGRVALRSRARPPTGTSAETQTLPPRVTAESTEGTASGPARVVVEPRLTPTCRPDRSAHRCQDLKRSISPRVREPLPARAARPLSPGPRGRVGVGSPLRGCEEGRLSCYDIITAGAGGWRTGCWPMPTPRRCSSAVYPAAAHLAAVAGIENGVQALGKVEPLPAPTPPNPPRNSAGRRMLWLGRGRPRASVSRATAAKLSAAVLGHPRPSGAQGTVEAFARAAVPTQPACRAFSSGEKSQIQFVWPEGLPQ